MKLIKRGTVQHISVSLNIAHQTGRYPNILTTLVEISLNR